MNTDKGGEVADEEWLERWKEMYDVAKNLCGVGVGGGRSSGGGVPGGSEIGGAG
jgi:hypothetical protein